MKNIEILAPVGASEQLKAAVVCGADAVYLGAGNFNARRNAQNFADAELSQTVKYCHLRNVKVYVTLNTLVFDKEQEELYKTVNAVAESGADAVIIQDFAVYEAVKNICPQMPLHASTQMAVHNVAGARFLENLGFSRIVLARELSLAEITEIRRNTKAELEIFVHGAHCMATSGNCYLSAMLGERSGNRGLCAQGCRLNWKSAHSREYALSLKDMSYADSVGDLIKAGVDSLKIEGRMKRPEYVAATVTAYKNAVCGKPYDRDTLRRIFSRSGFTDGYLQGKIGTDMFGYRGKDDVTSATGVLKDLRALYDGEIRPLKANAVLTLKPGEPAALRLDSGEKSVTVRGTVPEEPLKAPLTSENARRFTEKLGGTPFTLSSFALENHDSLTLSASSINAMRRDAVRELEEALTENTYKINSPTVNPHAPYRPHSELATRVRLAKFSQYSPVFGDCQFIILPLDEIIKNEQAIKPIAARIIAEIPGLVYPGDEKQIPEKLARIKLCGINHGAASNIGAVKMLTDAGFTVHGLHGLNITNTTALNFYASSGVEDTVLSFELTEKAMRNIGGEIMRGAYIYGHLPLMQMRACPQKSADGCSKCSGDTFLIDRKGVKFPVICENKRYSVLYNSVPLYLGDKNLSMLDFAVLYFTSESVEKCAQIYTTYVKKRAFGSAKTNGLFLRELL